MIAQAEKKPNQQGTLPKSGEAANSFFSKLMHPKRTFLGSRVSSLKQKIEAEKESSLWTQGKLTYYRQLSDTYEKLGEHENARKEHWTYLEKLLDMSVEDYYSNEMKVCRLMPDHYSAAAKKLARKGRYSEASELYRKQAEEYAVIGTDNIFMLPDKAFNASIVTKTVDLQMLAMPIYSASSLMFEMDLMRNSHRYEISGIARKRAAGARKNYEALAGIAEQAGAFERLVQNSGKLAVALARGICKAVAETVAYPFALAKSAYSSQTYLYEGEIAAANYLAGCASFFIAASWAFAALAREPGMPVWSALPRGMAGGVLASLLTATVPGMLVAVVMEEAGINSRAILAGLAAFAGGLVAAPFRGLARAADRVYRDFANIGKPEILKIGGGIF